ncbi:transporter, putative [Plasmodium knowlesi strain H]|uniref:Transporter, putative n=3 Tax=Plasmodium knowlesi TaxID=5850 RepID=A0A5K1V0Y4_PLAKH|nr:mitochondrial carrier protein, putative [Plasmodium knowlesi strain H]OTN67456.1 putative Transporter [Plasmodium knowlesi]CAA9987358.1 mitochondrial carrier protein, putative [Plasmodium knowlesi strain H]SBO23354.1 transporter, putative [Plasmodium knowlesi strain H]SBO24511.1 transporter, putative [Plasmodium knowlesi strain H]VVS76832.1 mitochondrial carrier protein, putative [Plasmodium knowlesi strain H]|eukprot:XP_002258361.1 transporter, putative [Plasmodium knowlesi strain H]
MGKKEKTTQEKENQMTDSKNDAELTNYPSSQSGLVREKNPHSTTSLGNRALRKGNTSKGENEVQENVEDTHISNSNASRNDTTSKYNIFIDKEGAINSILSSTFAGIMSRTVTAPLDRVKYIMQVTNNLPIYKIFEIIKKDGMVCGFFRGNCVNIVKIIPELSIKMYSYEFLKVNVYNYYRGDGANETEGGREGKYNYAKDQENLDIPFFIRFIIGSSSGVIAALFIYPLEIVKTRLIVSNKNDHNGIVKCFYNIYKNEQFRNFYNGLSMHIYGVILFSGCNMSIYDYLKYLFFTLYKDYIHSTYCMRSGYNSGDENATEARDANKYVSQKTHITNSNDNNHNHNNTTTTITNTTTNHLTDDNNISSNSCGGRETFLSYNLLNVLSYLRNKSTHWNNPTYAHQRESHLNKSECAYCNYRVKNVNCLSFLFFGITSSFIAQIVSYPFLVLRTRMQTLNNEITTNYLNNERKHIKSCSFILYNIRVYGFKSLYRGIYVNLLRTIPATSITWFAYEYAMRKLQAGVKL